MEFFSRHTLLESGIFLLKNPCCSARRPARHSKSARREKNSKLGRGKGMSYAFLFSLWFSREFVGVPLADHVAGLCAVGWADNAALFQKVHQTSSASVA